MQFKPCTCFSVWYQLLQQNNQWPLVTFGVGKHSVTTLLQKLGAKDPCDNSDASNMGLHKWKKKLKIKTKQWNTQPNIKLCSIWVKLAWYHKYPLAQSLYQAIINQLEKLLKVLETTN